MLAIDLDYGGKVALVVSRWRSPEGVVETAPPAVFA
jgi:hypothetical protein